jgi:hypothetical protein
VGKNSSQQTKRMAVRSMDALKMTIGEFKDRLIIEIENLIGGGF